MEISEILDKYNFKPITDLSLKYQDLILKYLKIDESDGLTVYAKIVEQLISFSDNRNKPLWNTKLSFSSVVVLRNGILFDKFILPLRIFRIRNAYENDALTDLFETLLAELDQFDTFIEEPEDEEYAYES